MEAMEATEATRRKRKVAECQSCRKVKRISARDMCGPCYKRIILKTIPRDPARAGIGGRIPIPGEGDFIVVLCKPGDEMQDEIPLVKHKAASDARRDCKRRNLAARSRGKKSRCFYFVSVNRTVRLPWVDRMLAKLEATKGEQSEE